MVSGEGGAGLSICAGNFYWFVNMTRFMPFGIISYS